MIWQYPLQTEPAGTEKGTLSTGDFQPDTDTRCGSLRRADTASRSQSPTGRRLRRSAQGNGTARQCSDLAFLANCVGGLFNNDLLSDVTLEVRQRPRNTTRAHGMLALDV